MAATAFAEAVLAGSLSGNTQSLGSSSVFGPRTSLHSSASRNVSLVLPCRRRSLLRTALASSDEAVLGSAASSSADSIVAEVASLPDAPEAAKKKLSPLEKGGTLKGERAAGKDPALATLGKSRLSIDGEKFSDPRWKNGTWELSAFTKEDGKVDWDAVIDSEVVRRQWLEENPESSTNQEPVVFETSDIPWWAWVRRFHLPEAEKLNGRAAMVGFALGYVVDSLTGVGLVDQTSGFFGKLLLLLAVAGILLVRKTEDISNIKNLADEWTFYDKQWQATWKEGPPPASSEKTEP
eukprot:TRINITY_DN569_c0_g1_i1.p1 TRINITY_DN569_c0_g1~~TRINITY_DN569_c0_g1_i1.p1  ORF type:complete len:294 (-),score=66.94 TRINITY_DN569_c0_g1_i1:281-1162(-)